MATPLNVLQVVAGPPVGITESRKAQNWQVGRSQIALILVKLFIPQ